MVTHVMLREGRANDMIMRRKQWEKSIGVCKYGISFVKCCVYVYTPVHA